MARRFTPLLESLPATVPFVPPEAIERRSGRPLELRLGANESAFGIAPAAREAMRQAVERSSWYGDPESFELRRRLASLHGVDAAQLVVGAGADDLLGMAVRAFVEPGEPVVSSLGGYATFAYHVRAYGARLCTVPYRDDKNDLEALVAAAAEHGARMLYLANPDNPTGSFHGPEAIARLVQELPPGCVLVLDEAYSDFVPAGGLCPIDPEHPQVMRVRTFSKAHGLAGARIGYALAAREVVACFDKFRLHFGVSRVAQAGALASLEQPAFLAGVVAEVAAGRAEYAALGEALGLPTLPSSTNFVAFDAGTGERARALLAALLGAGVFVRAPGVAPLDRLIRVTVGTAAERAAFASTLRRLAPGGPG